MKKFSRLSFVWLFTALVLIGAHLAKAQVHQGVELVKADLITDVTTIEPGKPFTVGLHLKMVPPWHTYWKYSGDAGLPTRIDWELPAGFTAGPIQWPLPEKFVSAGDVVNYGYHDEVVLFTQITPPSSFNPEDTKNVVLKAKVSWLVCAEICIPGTAQVSLDFSKLAQDPQKVDADAALIKKFQALLPAIYDPKIDRFHLSAEKVGDRYILTIKDFTIDPKDQIDFFPLPEDASLDIGHPVVKVNADQSNDTIVAEIPIQKGSNTAPIRLGGLVSVINAQGERTGWIIPYDAFAQQKPAAAASEKPVPSPTPTQIATPTATATPTPNADAASPIPVQGSIWYFLLLGFVGGLILNVMPCVLPVISLKIFSFVKQANENPARVWRLGVTYVCGIFTWFLAFAGLVVGLRAAGHEVGYAFHFQNPLFILALSAITFLFSLNLLGVYSHIFPPNPIVGSAAQIADAQEGYLGAFLQGILATVLASACTAPLFGPALGFAFGQPAVIVFAMFAAISFGMGLPFLILAIRPQWLRFLPKPGLWMERAKQLTGFALMATVLWLLMIIGALKGSSAILWTCFLLLMIGLAAWLHGTFNVYGSSRKSKVITYAIVVFLLIGSSFATVQGVQQATRVANPVINSGVKSIESNQPFSKQLDAALKKNRLVFVDFTAEWCVNCKVNERTVLSTQVVQDALKKRNAIFLKADWTDGAEDITHLLRHFGRAGVPLYVIYPAAKPDKPIVLPELLTTNIVLDGLKQADQAK